jgi:hypothetical protein
MPSFNRAPLAWIAALALAAPVAVAQQGYGGGAAQQGSGGPAAGAMSADSKTLDQFAEAFGEVQEIRQDFSASLEGVESESKARSLQADAQEKMVTAVQDAGLTVQEYNRIAMQIQRDPELREKVMERTN